MKIEIKNTKEEVIDWSKPQLVESKNVNGRLIRTNGKYLLLTFQGVDLSNGKFSKKWSVDYFKPFHGTVTLSND